MPKKGQRTAKTWPGDASDATGFAALCAAYLDALRVLNYSEKTVESRAHHLREFVKWAHERSLARPSEVTKPILERYQRYLYHHRKKNGQPLSFRSQHGALVPVRAFFKWLCRQNHLLANPAADLDLPRAEKRLPRHVLTASEAERVLALPDMGDALGLRDRAILEALYSTGMRRMELIGLKLYDLDQERGNLFLALGPVLLVAGGFLALLPLVAVAFGVLWIDRWEPEPRGLLVFGFLWGAIMSVAALLSLALGVLADLLRTNRRILEDQLQRTKEIQYRR